MAGFVELVGFSEPQTVMCRVIRAFSCIMYGDDSGRPVPVSIGESVLVDRAETRSSVAVHTKPQ
jgi:hypothetical protein